MKYTYLLLNFFTILVPFLRSFEPKLHFYKKWKFYFPALVITAIFFLVWDYFKTKYGIWSFNEDYILGLKLGGLPLEEYLFFITVPYACTFIYETVSHFIDKQLFPSWTRVVMYGLSGIALLSSFFVYEQAYTFSVLFIWGLTFPIVLNQFSAQALDKFLLTFLISIVPMFVVNGVLTGLPVVIYNNMENSGIRIGTIPVEDFLYNAILLAMNIGLYEWFKLKYKKD
jgi:lycopene cyclase domain-containing protein